MMKKERLAAFTDALLAIVMTILVLELNRPETLSWAGLWEIRSSFFSYALSFFWLGAMWVRLHNDWDQAENVSRAVVWWSIVLLFFTSLFPYTTSIVDEHFHNSFAQGMYGLLVMAVTAVFRALTRAMQRANPDTMHPNPRLAVWVWGDVIAKVIGLVLSITVYAPAMMLSVLFSFLLLMLPSHFFAAPEGVTAAERAV